MNFCSLEDTRCETIVHYFFPLLSFCVGTFEFGFVPISPSSVVLSLLSFCIIERIEYFRSRGVCCVRGIGF